MRITKPATTQVRAQLPLASTDELLITFFAPKDQGDEAVWAEDGPVVLKDLDDPGVRAKIRRVAAEQEARLGQ
ncbi:hypothetical protein ACLQ25_29300 [Micromonospora sp. DT44]|uniref:hypothetical protein n=1 Tax=Micromonospora sp. DT44 TaxID=3393439 RepID=UPI003CE7FE52